MPTVPPVYRWYRRAAHLASLVLVGIGLSSRTTPEGTFLLSTSLFAALGAAVTGFVTRRRASGPARHREISEREAALERLLLLLLSQRSATAAHPEPSDNDLLLMAAHDLRTPLTAILGRAKLLHMRSTAATLDSTWVEEQIVAIQVSAERMTRTIAEITDTAQLQMGHPLSLVFEPVDLVTLLREMAEVVVQTYVGWKIEDIHIVAARAAVTVIGDRHRLERVFQNLISNAVKYSPSVTPIVIIVADANGSATVDVRDSGVGIPDDELPHVCTHFYRASTARGIAGSGLGLAGSKAIIEQHGGQIALKSVVGAGTTVAVTLPQAGPCPPLPSSEVDLTGGSLGISKIGSPTPPVRRNRSTAPPLDDRAVLRF